VAPGAGDFDGTLGGLLASDFFEVNKELLGLTEKRITIGLDGGDALAGVDEMDHVEQRAHGVDFYSAHHGGFFGVGLRHDHPRNLAATSFDGNRESATNAANSTVEREFAYKKAVGDFFLSEATIGSNDSKRHGEVESRTFFFMSAGARLMVISVGGMS
jgi:hypothetical protein